MASAIMKIKCPDERGLVYRVTEILYRAEVNLLSTHEYVDEAQNLFFMRVVLDHANLEGSVIDDIRSALPQGAELEFLPSRPKKLVLMVGKESHCPADMLVKCKFAEYDAEIVAVISNHDVLQSFCESFGVPFHHIPTGSLEREQHEERIHDILRDLQFDYIILAKYMRILTPDFTKAYENKVINIHHSFLPAFIGAKPYHQAHARGVKLIGATCHFVTADLDQGPIICQNVSRVSHAESVKQFIHAGREIEKSTLATGVRLVLEDRVMINGGKTVVF